MKLTKWGDIFKFSSQVLEDDYNDGQHLVVKVSTKAENNGELTLTAKHAHAKQGEQTSKLATELRLKQSLGQGSTYDMKLKNSGVQSAYVEYITDLKWISDVDMGNIKAVYKMDGLEKHQVGLELKDKETIARGVIELSRQSPKLIGEFCHKVADDRQFGSSFEIATKDMSLDSHKWDLGTTHHIAEGQTVGAKASLGGKQTDIELKKLEFYTLSDALKTTGQSWVSQLTWDIQKGTASSQLGLQHQGDGYQTRFKVDDQGVIRGQLKWQLHKTTTAILHSESQIQHILDQKSDVPKLGLALEMKL